MEKSGLHKILIYSTVFLCGAIVMALEILGTRLIGPYFGASLSVWIALITVTLTSLSVGYWIGGKIADYKPSIDLFYGIILTAGAILLIIPLFSRPVLVKCSTFGLLLGSLASATLLFAIPLILLGAVSPFAVKLQAQKIGAIGITAGRLYALSTLGSVFGAFLTGYFLLPLFGIKCIIYALALLLTVLPATWWMKIRSYPRLLICLPLATLCFFLFFPARKLAKTSRQEVVYISESLYGQIRVIDQAKGPQNEPPLRFLLIDGAMHSAIDTNSKISVFEYIHGLHLLPFLNPEGSRALLIGLGGGSLVEVLKKFSIKTDVVEIDPKIIETAKRFFDFKPEGGTVYLQDGRTYLRGLQKKYDFIILDAYAGDVAPLHLFSKEMFEQCKEALSENGICAINMLGFAEGKESRGVRSVYATLKAVFPFVEAYSFNQTRQLNNILFFAATRSRDYKIDFNDPRITPITKNILQNMLNTKLDQAFNEGGVILTDDYSPLPLWSRTINKSWRKKIFAMFDPEILLN